MASLDGAKIEKGKFGANALAIGDGVSGLVAAAVAASSLALGTVANIFNVVDAENLGINAAYDEDNNVNVYRHITEFYRIAGEGVKLFVLLVPQISTLVEICEGANDTLAKKLITEGAGEIRQI